jgi:hypothetical protein
VEGRDYHLDKLLPFWQLTSEQDWRLCEENQMGMLTSHYRPGPLSAWKEQGLETFFKWYLKTLKSGAAAFRPPPQSQYIVLSEEQKVKMQQKAQEARQQQQQKAPPPRS